MKEYRVVTQDWVGMAESVEDAVDRARNDMGARVHAEETGIVDERDDDDYDDHSEAHR